MTLDEEIMFAKNEKEFNEDVDKIMSNLDFENCNEEADVLNLKYSEAGELINNYNFKESIAEYARGKEFSKEDAYLLGTILGESFTTDDLYKACKKAQVVCESAKERIEKSNSKNIMESYDVLSRMYIFLEAAVGKKFLAAYTDGSKVDNYIKLGTNYYIKKGYSPEEAKDKATQNYETRAAGLNIKKSEKK